MNIHIKDREFRRNRRASALVIVLASLAFLAALALAFLASVGTELKSSKRYADGTSVKLLSQSTFNLASSQIALATKGVDSSGNTLAWASQPGMIRTYNDSGAKDKYYKLYSWDTMSGSGNFDPAVEKTALDGWDGKKALFTDLNEPIKNGTSLVYPIVDGNIEAVSGVPGKTYKLNTSQAIEGFYVNGIPSAATTGNPVPMPVKWLYVLENGEIVTATSTATPGEAQVSGASNDNPIVGRIAFWTDDETCKVNLNTASEAAGTGSFFDTPRVSSAYDLTLAKNPPYKNEFQRYPGHPATVSLSTVFRNLTSDSNYPESVYALTPRTSTGGSLHGTVVQFNASSPAPMNVKADRLYASVDEFIFKPEMVGTARKDSNTDLNSSAKFSASDLERAKFFVTVSSRAPDLNLFNKPRVCMWPINTNTDDNHRTAYDKLIAFCSTVPPTPTGSIYYFQRNNYLSQLEWTSIPRNETLINYLRNFADQKVPGFGGSTFAAKYSASSGGGKEIDQILMEIFDYIRCTNLRDSSGPGTFVPFNNPASSDNKGVVIPSYNSAKNVKGFGRFPTVSRAAIMFIAAGAGPVAGPPAKAAVPQVLSVSSTSTNYGPAIPADNVRVQAALVFSMFDPSQGYQGIYPTITFKIVSSTVQWNYGSAGPAQTIFAPGSISTYGAPGGEYSPWGGTLGNRLLTDHYNGNSFVLSPVPASSGAAAPYPDFPVGGTMNLLGGDIKVELSLSGVVVQTITFRFPPTSVPVPRIPVTPIVSIVHSGGGPTGTSYLYLTNFNDPGVAAFAYGRFNTGVNTNYTSSNAARYLISSYDTVRSVQSESGDMRLVAARANILGGDQFKEHPFYYTGSKPFAHGFTASNGTTYYGSTRGQLVKSATAYNVYPAGSMATLASPSGYNDPQGSNGIASSEPDGFGSSTHLAVGVKSGSLDSWSSGDVPGDFDNGTGSVKDGPYINKADEGAIQGTAGYPAYYGVGSGSNAVGESYFAPNRQVPSPGILGSLPTGVIGDKPWQTLLFHPDPTGLHAGSQSPPDYLFLDLFNMPVVDPYAISEPLSTAGRINMNYQVIPFTYINRDTGVRAVLKSQQMLSISNAYHGQARAYGTTTTSDYKQQVGQYNPGFGTAVFRFPVNIDETLKGFTTRFATGDIFRSASEICALDLVPNDTTDTNAKYGSTMKTYWENHQLTGDNSRERPYANIYPLLTTKSNTFTVYARVQTLKKPKSSSPDIWVEGKDQITGEYRGYQTVERYFDASSTGVPDYTSTAATTPISTFYKNRVLASKQFSP